MTDHRTLVKAARACSNLELGFGGFSHRDRAAISLAYTCCRVVVLCLNGYDQAAPGSSRVRKSGMPLTKKQVLARLQAEYDELVKDVKMSKWKVTP